MRKDKPEYFATGQNSRKENAWERKNAFKDELEKCTNCDNMIDLSRKDTERELIVANVFMHSIQRRRMYI